jgi:Na+-transporting NADH:ubiquinone oxidoreductase subunit C
MSDRLNSFLFAALLCVISSVLLTAASTGLQNVQQKNMLVDKQKNILKSVGLVRGGEDYSGKEIETLFSMHIRPLWVDSDGRLVEQDRRSERDIPLYVRMENGTIRAYIVPIDSKGLWGRIQGYLAIENDGSTVAGFTVFKHSETPGLGGEIEKEWFQKNWVGKKIVDRDGHFVSIGITRGAVKDVVPVDKRANYVDGISGATLTGKYLSTGLSEVLKTYEPVAIRFRKNLAAGPAREG